jgi:exodeoxyribonuclease V alpha subunit
MFDFTKAHPVDALFSGVDCGFIPRTALAMQADARRVKLDITNWIAEDRVVGISINSNGARALAVADQHKRVKAAADAVRALAAAESVKLCPTELADIDMSALTDEQRIAVQLAFSRRLSVMTGGPGTGKTHTVATIVRSARSLGYSVLLLAPTGKAARRMTEMSGEAARTIHSWIRYPYGAHLIIIDESSMIDQAMFCRLITTLEGLTPKPNIVMVGDTHQLPSVEHGEVLRDVIDYLEGRELVTRLSKVHRQSTASPGIAEAASLLASDRVIRHGYGHGFSRLCEHDIVEATVRFAGWANGTGQSWMVLSPYRSKRYEGNIGELNGAISKAILGDVKAVGGFRAGDRILFTENNWDAGYVNGQVGTISSIGSDDAGKFIIIESEDRFYRIDWQDRGHIELAWATTVHKAQGSEADIVAVVLASDERLQKELLYTAITRGKCRVFLICGAGMKGTITTAPRPHYTTMLGVLLNVKQGA